MFKTRLDNLGTILGVFWILKNFKKHFEDSTLLGTLGKKNFREKYPKTCSKHFWTIWERFWAFLEFWNFFDFLKAFRRLHPPWNTGQKEISEESTPKQVQDTFGQFGNVSGRFLSFKSFYIFWKHFEDLTLHGTLGKKISKKSTPKHVQNTFGHFWERFWAFFAILKIFCFFENISKTQPSMENWAKKNFGKKYPKTCSKHVWTLLGTILGIFAILKIFCFFENISKTQPSMENWAKKIRKNYPKTSSNTFGHFWEQFWAFLGNLKVVRLFENISKIDPPWNTGQEKILEKSTPKHVQNTFGHFWERFWAFLQFWKFFVFLKTFRRLNPPWKTGQKKFGKIIPKHLQIRLDTFGNNFGHFWEIWKLFDFSKTFRRSTLHGTLGKKKFWKKIPQNMFKTRLEIFRNDFGIFGNLKNFWFFEIISKTRPSMEHWAKNFFRKKYPKTCSKHFRTIWERFWAFLEF